MYMYIYTYINIHNIYTYINIHKYIYIYIHSIYIYIYTYLIVYSSSIQILLQSCSNDIPRFFLALEHNLQLTIHSSVLYKARKVRKVMC